MSNINAKYMNATIDNGLSIGLRLIMHYVGDVHQPLHGSTRVNHEYPEGDRGGNDFPLAMQDGIKELHAVWDSMAFEHTGYAPLPYSDADWVQQGKNASDLVNKHAANLPYDVTDMSFVNWANESFMVTEQFVYTNI